MIRNLCAFALTTVLALPADAGPSGCFARSYDANHLARHPDQVVREMRLGFQREPTNGELFAILKVVTANGGHAARAGLGGQPFDQGLICFEEDGPIICAVECDGGSFEVTRDTGDMIEITTRYLMAGDTEGCGGAIDLAEVPDQPVTYRLFRAEAAQCWTE